jgi:hypothetical protein
MNNDREENRRRLIEYLREDFIDRDNYSFGVHMDDFVFDPDDRVSLLRNAVFLLQDLVYLSEKNDWTRSFEPILCFYLKSVSDPGKARLPQSYSALIDELDGIVLPEVMLQKKGRRFVYCFYEQYKYPTDGSIFYDLFSEELFDRNYHFYYFLGKHEDDIEEGVEEYCTSFDIIYSKNRPRKRKPVRLKVKDENSLSF